MQRVLIALTFLLAGLAVTSKAQAQFGFWRRAAADYERNKYFPEPFLHWDRQAARQPFAIMVDKGWQLENTVGEFHFDRETNQLTTAGYHKVGWIVTETPQERRTVFVQRGDDAQSTADRVDSVQRAISRFVIEGPLPEVVTTHSLPPGTPADVIDRIYRGRDASQPAPVLPAAESSSSSQ